LQEIAATVDRIVIINRGQIVANGTSQELMSSLRGQTQLTLEVKNATDEIVANIANQVGGIELVNTDATDGLHVLSIAYERGTDPREEIFNYAKNSGWTILEMSQTRVQLEDVFRTLTAEGGGRA
jgi:ABC-2 type transport system ATP-binding protein